MSLAIKPEKVVAVLLADGWHELRGGLRLDAYEYVEDGEPVFGDGSGFEFTSGEKSWQQVAGPMRSILAVRHSPDEEGS